MDRKFKTGDVVCLASDSLENQPMTIKGYVIDIESMNPQSRAILKEFSEMLEGKVRCDWRDKQDQPHTHDYHEDQLIKK